MLPILYNSDSTLEDWFGNNGLGFIRMATNCLVTQEANGVYEAAFNVPLNDRLVEYIKPGAVVKLRPNGTDSPQPFDIVNVKCSSIGLTVTAQHLRYRVNGNVFSEPYTVGTAMTPQEVWNDIQDYLVYDNPFTFTSAITTTGRPNAAAESPIKLGEFLFGHEGSMIDTYKGLHRFNYFNIQMVPYVSARNDICLRAGSGLVDVDCELSNEYMFTDISPTANIPTISMSGEEVGSLSVNIETVPISGSTLNYSRALAYDFTEQFARTYPNFKIITASGGAPTPESYQEAQDKLSTVTENYITSNRDSLTRPTVNMNVTTQPEIEQLKNVRLGDMIGVYFEPLGLTATTRVVRTVYDAIGERYTRIVCGDTRRKLSNLFSDKNFGGL